jgi:hypothetical protein
MADGKTDCNPSLAEHWEIISEDNALHINYLRLKISLVLFGASPMLHDDAKPKATKTQGWPPPPA